MSRTRNTVAVTAETTEPATAGLRRTRTPRALGPGEAADRILALRRAQQSEVETACAELIAKHQARQQAREEAILEKCVDPVRARAILALDSAD